MAVSTPRNRLPATIVLSRDASLEVCQTLPSSTAGAGERPPQPHIAELAHIDQTGESKVLTAQLILVEPGETEETAELKEGFERCIVVQRGRAGHPAKDGVCAPGAGVSIPQLHLVVIDVGTEPIARRAPLEASKVIAPRKIQTIEHIDREPREHLTLRNVEIRRGRAGDDLAGPATPPVSDPPFTPRAEFAARTEFQPSRGQTSFGEPPAGIVEHVDDPGLIADLTGNEIARERIQRLVDLGEQARLPTGLRACPPLSVQRVTVIAVWV